VRIYFTWLLIPVVLVALPPTAIGKDYLPPGEFAAVTLILGEVKDAVIIPVTAVLSGQNGKFLFVVGADGSLRLLRLVNQTALDLKGPAISRSVTPLLALTTALCRAWSG